MTIFTQTYAIFSPQFSKSFSNFQDDPLFQRICDCVGVVYVQDGDGHKLLGSWESVKNAHDILSAFLILKSLSDNSNNTQTNQQEKSQEKSHPFGNDYEAVTPNVCASGSGYENQTEIQKDSPVASRLHNMDVDRVTEINDSQDYNSDEVLLGNYQKNPQFQEEMLKAKVYYDEDGNEVYYCDMCSYMGHTRHNLVIHRIRTHIRPYKCERCSRGFGLPKDLKRHYKNKRNCVVYGTDYKRNVWRGKEPLYFNPQSSPVNTSNIQQENIDNLSNNVANGLNFKEADKELSKSLDHSLSKQHEDESTKNVQTEEQIENKEPEETVVVNVKTEVVDDDYDNLTKITDRLPVSVVPVQIIPQIASNIQSTSQAPHSFENHTFTHDVDNFSSTSVSENGSEVVLKCHICSFTCSKRQQIEDHIKRIHCKKFECTICGSMFGMMKDLNRHYRRTHKMQIKCQRRGRRPAESGIMWRNDIDQC